VHVEILHNFVRRSVYVCLTCLSKTIPCDRKVCQALARNHSLWSEASCLVCAERSPSWDLFEPAERARCDWCEEFGLHVLQKTAGLFRSTYVCAGCHGIGVRCKGSVKDEVCPNFARSHGSYDEDYCRTCKQIPPEMLAPKNKVCSWCLARSDHGLHELSTLSRPVYECGSCKCKTVECVRCTQACGTLNLSRRRCTPFALQVTCVRRHV
jgi:hypothetical protein